MFEISSLIVSESVIIMGVDPGTTIMGYSIIEVKGKDIQLLSLGVIELHKLDDAYDKLGRIFSRITGLIDEFKPTELAIEAPFFGKNVQSMLKLGRAQGVAIAGALSRNLTVTEYAPRKIKMSITGSGSASKEQVAGMLQKILKMKEMPQYLDATDALGAAVCHYYQLSSPLAAAGSSAKSWKEFIAKNPGRIK